MKRQRKADSPSEMSPSHPRDTDSDALFGLGNQEMLALMSEQQSAAPGSNTQHMGSVFGIPASLLPGQATSRVPLPREIPDEVLERATAKGKGKGEPKEAPQPAERSEVPYSDLPAAFRRVADGSFKDSSRWYHGLSALERSDTIDVYNRLVAAGLWGEVVKIRRVVPGEANVNLGFITLGVSGNTVSVELEVEDSRRFSRAVMDSGAFGKDGPIMGAAHAGQDSFRESSSDDGFSNEGGAHVAVGNHGEADVHIDRISPVGRPDAHGNSQAIGPRMLGHGTLELIPGILRGLTGIPGLTPLQNNGGAERNDPTDRPYEDPISGPFFAPGEWSLLGIVPKLLGTLGARTQLRYEWPAKPGRPQQLEKGPVNSTGTPISAGETQAIDAAVSGLAGKLIPPYASETGEYNDTSVTAQEFARRMVDAQAAGKLAISFDHGPAYKDLTDPSRVSLEQATRDIAIAVRAALGEKAASILYVSVSFAGGRKTLIELP